MDFKHPIQEYFKFSIIRDLCRFLQPGLSSSTIFHKNFTRFFYCQPYKIFKLIMGSIPNDCKHLLRTETSQKSLLKIFCYNNEITWKVKDSQKLSKRNSLHPSIKIVLNSAKYNKPFKFISWPNFLEEHHILSPHVWGKTFIDWFKKYFDG